jgi:hypothetical protein
MYTVIRCNSEAKFKLLHVVRSLKYPLLIAFQYMKAIHVGILPADVPAGSG